MTAYFVGDIPAEDMVVEPARRGEAIDLALFDGAEITLLDPTNTVVTTSGFTTTLGVDTLIIEWPGEAVLTDPGLYHVNIVLDHSTTGVRERITPIPVVVESADGWVSLENARSEWADAPLDDDLLYVLLRVARTEVIQFAPALTETDPIPMNFRQAQLMHAVNRWNARAVDPAGGGIGGEGFVLRPFPLDWAVKQVLRPKNPAPWVA